MDLHHETSRWKGMQISFGRVRLLKTGVNRRKIIRCSCYSPEMLLVRPLSAINLSLSSSVSPRPPGCTVTCIFIHGLSKKNMGCCSFIAFFHQGFNHHLPITHICCLQTDTQKHTVLYIVETSTFIDEKNKKIKILILLHKGQE